ncbi:ASCH domain-containing protein [Raineyella fluvialis]|uniref:ASCH domain-containing protein n=1 Tax=Raineyella fluvialis TaxID=2662261 RepID=A0A5Q2F648_9ACTN|nr:ASCH domain-containing protein [Raineyella fluvialis]QGF22442.1 ASCH domain-containing protein [Raineyella fluvialis]
MKTLTVRQPWARLIMAGIKHHETRTWTTAHRGQLAIHAGMTWAADAPCRREPSGMFVADEPLRRALGQPDPNGLTWSDQRGAILGEVTLVDVVETSAYRPTDLERLLGDYGRGLYAWVLADPIAYAHPIRAKGRLGLWNWQHSPTD